MPQQEIEDISALITHTPPEHNVVEFTKETPLPTPTESIQQSKSSIAHQLSYINDDDSKTGTPLRISDSQTCTNQPIATLKTILHIGTAYSPPSNPSHMDHHQPTHTATFTNSSGNQIDCDTHPPSTQATESAFKHMPMAWAGRNACHSSHVPVPGSSCGMRLQHVPCSIAWHGPAPRVVKCSGIFWSLGSSCSQSGK